MRLSTPTQTTCIPSHDIPTDKTYHSQETSLDSARTYSSWCQRQRATRRPTGCSCRSQQVRPRSGRARWLSMLSFYYSSPQRRALSVFNPLLIVPAPRPLCSYTYRSFLFPIPTRIQPNANPRLLFLPVLGPSFKSPCNFMLWLASLFTCVHSSSCTQTDAAALAKLYTRPKYIWPSAHFTVYSCG